MTKAKTPLEKRRDIQAQIDELAKSQAQIDAATVEAVRAIFERAEVQQALVDLKALGDPEDLTAGQRFPTADTAALVANLALPFERAVEMCDHHKARLEAVLNPAAASPPLPIPPAQ